MTSPATDATGASDARSRQLYRLVADTVTDVVYETDQDGVIQWMSPSVHELLGWEPAQLLGTSAPDLVHPVDRERIDALRSSFYRDGHSHDDVTCMISTATGTYREVTLRTRPILGVDETVVGAVVTITDTHDRDSALRALTTLSQANHALVRAENETDLLQRMCDTVVQAGRYLFAWYGRAVDDPEQSVQPVAKAGEHHGYLDEITVSWGDNPLGRGPTGRCLRSRQTQVENDFERDPEYQPWEHAATGRGFKSSISLPVMVDGRVDGALMVYAAEPGAFDALAQDLLEDLAADLGYGIERLRGAEELARTTQREAEQRQRLQSTLDSQFDPFVLLAAVRDEAGRLVDLRYVEANAAAVAYNQLPRDELIGTCVLDRYPNQRGTRAIELYFRTIETGEPTILDDYAYENLIIGNERRYDIRAVKSGDAVALTWRDVTDRHVAAMNLADSERRYRLLAENSSDVVILADEHANLRWVSTSAQQTLGWDPVDLLGHSSDEYIHPEDLEALHTQVARSNRTGETVRPRYRWRRPDGTYRWMEAAGTPIADDGTGQPGRVVSLRDIDAEVRAEQDLAAREEHYRLLAENASDMVWQVAPDGSFVWVSPSVRTVLGWESAELIGTDGMRLIHPDDRARAVEGRHGALQGQGGGGEFRVLRPDGSTLWMELTVHPVRTDAGVERILALRNVEEEVAARTQLEFSLGHDQATGLATRQVFLDRIDYLKGQLPPKHEIGALCIGIDALSEVNEALTHAAGDLVMTTVAARVTVAVGTPDLVGRGSGDEVLVLLPDLPTGSDAAATAERIRLAVQGSIEVAGEQLFPTVSVGIATGDAGTDAEQLLRDASLALRKAKNNGRDRYEFADPGLAVEAQRRISLEAGLRVGLGRHEFVPWFQPIVELAEGGVEGYEALVRWVHPDGTMEPDDFIPVAIATGQMTEIDLAMIDPVVAALARLPEAVFVGVNVTGQTLARTAYADLVSSTLADHGVSPARLHIEVTETMLLALDDAVVTQIRNLADLGCRWYVDDFGTGYSSISHLRDLPVSGLKLDKSFTFGIGAGERTAMQLAGALIGLANGLGLDTVAEGVETQAEADYLRTLGWRHGQGWLYGKAAPLP